MNEESPKTDWINRLIAFFKTLPGKRSGPSDPDYSRWQQTEEEYQQEQAEWMEAVRRRKTEKQQREQKDADRKGD
ncbi:MAG: hypothetical protein R6X08_00160 [Desulfosalsimonadaceae bacterium]